MYHLTALATLLAILLYSVTGIRVGGARRAYGVVAPATTGHPAFERVFRVQMNTLEWLPIFLPALWLFAVYISDAIAAGIGLVWIIGRVLYMVSYTKDAASRGPGFMVQMLAALALWCGAIGAVVWQILK
jgi:glutathione S-transferase